jgi:glycosyltransferase involved in cell wall biosynthesis
MDVFHDYKGLSLLIVGELENEIYAKRILDQIGRLEDLGVPILKKFENLPHLQIINDYDVLVTPSRFEGGDFTLVMMESLMAGKLVITGILPAQTKLPFVKYYNFSGDNLIQDIEKFLLEHEDEVEDQIRYFTALNKRNRDDAFIQIKQLLAGNAI